MRILALETSSLRASVAASRGPELVRQHSLAAGNRTAQSLAPTIDRLLADVGWRPADLEAIAVAAGPGSFTGLRIGVTTAKTLAYATGARVIAVDTLHALAWSAASSTAEGETIMPLIDAHRNQLFAARYLRRAEGGVAAETAVEILDIDAWLAGPTPQAWLTGPILAKLLDTIARTWPAARLCPEEHWSPSAAAVAAIAWERAQRGEFDDHFALVPRYHRPSYAEEKRTAAGGQNPSP